MTDKILEIICKIPTPGFFVTAEFIRISDDIPQDIKAFILQKLELIKTGIPARKFVFTEKEWRIYLTFFPTDSVVDKKYGLMNQVVKSKKNYL